MAQSSEKSTQNFHAYTCKLENAGVNTFVVSRILMTGNKDAELPKQVSRREGSINCAH